MALPDLQDRPLEPTPYQARMLAVPESYSIMAGGGMGGGKTFGAIFLVTRHVEQYGRHARVLVLRKSFPELTDLENELRDVFGQLFGSKATYNAQSHIWRFDSGATVELGCLDGQDHFERYRGRAFTLAWVDEVGQYPEPTLLDLLRTRLRGPKDVPKRMILSGNPGGPGQSWIAARYILSRTPWEPFIEEESGTQWVYAPSIFTDNPHLDAEEYEREMRAATATDRELQKALLKGDWTAKRGAYFSTVLDRSRVLLEDASPEWLAEAAEEATGWRVPEISGLATDVPGLIREAGWSLYLAHDYGSSAPSVTYVVLRLSSSGLELPDGRWAAPGSFLLLDEMATNEPGSLTRGSGYTIPDLAEKIQELAERWHLRRAEGVADDACFAQHGHEAGSIAEEFKRHGVRWRPAKKGSRTGGWERMRTLLQGAGAVDEPGLYVAARCKYFWQTVPSLPRDPRRPDDVDTNAADHAADACRYAVLHRGREVSGGRVPWAR